MRLSRRSLFAAVAALIGCAALPAVSMAAPTAWTFYAKGGSAVEMNTAMSRDELIEAIGRCNGGEELARIYTSVPCRSGSCVQGPVQKGQVFQRRPVRRALGIFRR